MESLNERLERTFLKPQGKISRYFSTFFIFLAGIGGIYIYFAIEYFLCISNKCSDLLITKTWVNTPVYFVIYGICCLVIGVYVWRSKQLQTMFVWSIDILVGSSFLLLGKAFFAIAIEIGKST